MSRAATSMNTGMELMYIVVIQLEIEQWLPRSMKNKPLGVRKFQNAFEAVNFPTKSQNEFRDDCSGYMSSSDIINLPKRMSVEQFLFVVKCGDVH